MDTKNPKSFMAAKLSARAVETSNMKNAQVFNISYTPGQMLIKSELEKVTDDLADYVSIWVLQGTSSTDQRDRERRSAPSWTRNPSHTSTLT